MPASMQPYVEDADENEEPIDGSKTYNSSGPPSVKEEANVSRTRNTDKQRSASPTVDTDRLDDSDFDFARDRRSPTKREPRRSKDPKDKERERTKAKRKSVTYEQPRPRHGRSKTTPNLNVETVAPSTRRQPELAPAHFIATGATNARPRAYTAQTTPRPVSYYGSPGYGSPGGTISRPPLSNMRYYGQPALGTSFPPPPPQSPYPPPSPMFFPPSTAPPFAGPYPPAQVFSPASAFGQPQPDYFSPPHPHHVPARLAAGYRRPQSAMGNHRPAIGYDSQYEDERDDGADVVRVPRLKKRPSTRKQEAEKKLMPPPRIRRPSSAVATHAPFGPPRNRQSVESNRSFEYQDSDDESLYSPSEQSRPDWRAHSVRRPIMDTAAYEIESYHERSPERRRRNSQYGARAQSTEREYEDKFQHAQRYQERVDGPTNPITVDALRKIARTPSLRTKSTGSRGNDNHALTNRNSLDEDMRILIKGAATLTIGGASMDMQEGAEIRVPTSLGGTGTLRGESNGSDITYDDRDRRLEDRERRTRSDRPQARTGRATSRAGSHSRGLPTAGYYAPSPQTDYSAYGYHYPQQAPMYAPPSGLPYP